MPVRVMDCAHTGIKAKYGLGPLLVHLSEPPLIFFGNLPIFGVAAHHSFRDPITSTAKLCPTSSESVSESFAHSYTDYACLTLWKSEKARKASYQDGT
jgi:hypothetical protein